MSEAVSTRPLLDKLGVKPGARVTVAGAREQDFVASLAQRGADVSVRRRTGVDLIFVFCERERDLARIAILAADLERNGALWVIRRKGKGAPIAEAVSQAAGLAAGLVDVKVVSFSDERSAEKYVYRLRDR